MHAFKNSTIVIGISGVTCGGKTTLANAVQQAFPHETVACLSQDDYFLKKGDPRHTWHEEINHINYDILTSMDMEKMGSDVLTILNDQKNNSKIDQKQQVEAKPSSIEEVILSTSRNGFMFNNNPALISVIKQLLHERGLKLVIMEGFCIFNDPFLADLCDLKFYFTLNEEECKKRRVDRAYDPPDCVGYFEKCAWPEHLMQLVEVKKTVKDVIYFDEQCKDALHDLLSSLYMKINH